MGAKCDTNKLGENSYMIKNKFYSLMTSAAVLTTLAGAPLTAVIANAENTTSDQTAQVEFTAGTNGPEVTTTTDGPDGIPGNEDDNMAGDALAPSFGFGPHALTGAAQNRLAVVDNSNRTTDKVTGDKSTNKVLSMTDNSGKGAGYTVTAQLGDFTDEAGDTLPAAVLHINAAGAVSSNPEPGTVDGTPKASSVDLTAAGDDGTVLTAAKDQGMGTYTTDLSTGTTLDVPNAQYTGKYVAPLTYTVATTVSQP